MTIIAISNTHVGAPHGNTNDFLWLLGDLSLRADEVTDLVLCGDILDFWRCGVMDMMLESADAMSRLIDLADEGVNVHYIAGNHDYIMRKAESKHKRINFSTSLELFDDGRRWAFLHGWEFDASMNPAYFDAFCYANTTHGDWVRETFREYLAFLPTVKAARAWISGKRIQSDISEMFSPRDKSRLENTLENIPPTGNNLIDTAQFPEGGLVVGHTHLPYLDPDEKMVDCGSWHNGYPVHNTYIEIEGSTVSLRWFEG